MLTLEQVEQHPSACGSLSELFEMSNLASTMEDDV
jgi:hypothetical protein